jgi:hypothetical protein
VPAEAPIDRQLLINALLPVYGPVIKVIVERSDDDLAGDALQSLRSTLLQAGVDGGQLQQALEAARQPAPAGPDPDAIRMQLRLEFGPVASLLITPAWLAAWSDDPVQAEAQLQRRGLPDTLLHRLRTLLNA